MYIPRAKRSQTTPPPCGSHVPSKSRSKKSDKTKSKSVEEKESTSNSEDASEQPEISDPPQRDNIVTCSRTLDTENIADCDFKIPNGRHEILGEVSTNEKNKKNLNNLSTMSEQEKILTIESAAGINGTIPDKDDKDEKELIKASQEINRSNRKLIKQTFNSNVLEIEAAGGASGEKTDDKAVDQEEDDWDTLWV